MTREALIALQALAEALPVGQAVPVPREWLLELLARKPVEGDADQAPAVDLTCHQVADALGRDASTVRSWVARGDFPGAYRLNGREWRIPPESLRAWQEGQRRRPSDPAVPIRGGRRLPLSSWRSTPAEPSR
jgi:excisionase family DNA binding protein